MVNSSVTEKPFPSPPAAAADYELLHVRAPAMSFLLRRGFSIPSALDLRRINGGAGDLELRHWGSSSYSFPDSPGSSSYTSLRDIISSPRANSPSASGPGGVSTPIAVDDIQIKNRLLKQAAYAYLTPTPSATDSSLRRRRSHLRRVLDVVTCGLADSCLDCLGRLFRSFEDNQRIHRPR